MTSESNRITQRIIAGPGQWDLAVSFFEKKPVRFTLGDGSFLNLECITSIHNMAMENSLQQLPNEMSSGIKKGYLIAGTLAAPAIEQEAYIEYTLSPKTSGICAVVSWDDCCEIENWYLPRLWSKEMGLENIHTED